VVKGKKLTHASTTQRRVCIAFGRGCPRAQVDTARLFEYFRANGWDVGDPIEEADMVVVTTCGFCQDYEDHSLQLLESTDRRRKEGSRLVVVGCLAGINEERLRGTFDADIVSPMNATDLDAVIGATVPLEDIDDPNLIEPIIGRASRCFDEEERRGQETFVRFGLRWAYDAFGVKALIARARRKDQTGAPAPANRVYSLRVAQGCMGECTYCAIKFACGPLKSKPLDRVLAEFDRGLRAGYTEFTLIAQDLGSFGQDLGITIVDLLEGLLARPDDFRLTLLDFDPRWLIEYQAALVPLLASNRSRIRRMLVPLQSGSERVLESMRRGHTARNAREALLAVRAACPGIILETHMLLGFPGESEQDFQDTVALLQAIRFDSFAAYDYEDRPGTVASQMAAKVPRKVIKSRGLRLRRHTTGLATGLIYYFQDWGLRPSAHRRKPAAKESSARAEKL
jgi:tRNA A37 methylthiotransferase MiaB